jgi:Thermophilic metalloprotease (M29)
VTISRESPERDLVSAFPHGLPAGGYCWIATFPASHESCKVGGFARANASEGADVLRAQVATDEGAAHLGEVALVDGSSEVGKLGLTSFNTLFDENAT